MYVNLQLFIASVYVHNCFQELGQLRHVVFVIDSSTCTTRVRDIAELMHDVLIAIQGYKTPILVICNKQDQESSKSSQIIKILLEKELSLVCRTRAATLKSTSDTNQKTTLFSDGEFSWDRIGKNVKFHDCTATNDEEAEAVKMIVFN